MNRRQFLYLLGLIPVGISLSTIPLLRGSPSRRSPPAPSANAFAHIFYYASLAPSGHNTQPWQLIRGHSDQDFRLMLNQDCCLPEADPCNREALLSLGAFLENLIQTAPTFGYQAIYRLDDRPDLCIHIEFTACNPDNEADACQWIARRRTLRKSLDTSPLTDKEQSDILDEDVCLAFYGRDSVTGRKLAEYTLIANQRQSMNYGIQSELNHWIRWTTQEQEAHLDGLSPDTMEMNFALKWLAEYFISPSDFLSPRVQQQSLKLIEQQVQQGAGWLVCVSPDEQRINLLQAGQRFERAWLRAASLGIALHPMTQALEETSCRKKLQRSFPGQTIQFVARLGHCAAYPPPVSARRPVNVT